MSTKAALKGIAALLMMLGLSGCITTEVKITLNPDGSGTLEYTRNFDRAPEDVRQQLKLSQQDAQSPVMEDLSKEGVLDNYPKPHFQLLVYENDKDALRSRIVLKFDDINALLVNRDKANLGLKALDFKVDGDTLVFSVKEKKIDPQWPEKYDGIPGKETITIINAKNGEKVSFSRELTSKTEPAGWTGLLRFPKRLFFFGGHNIVRTPDVLVFHDYPVVQSDACHISSAQWSLSNHKQWSFLELKLSLSLPKDGYSYISWDNPVALSGKWRPEQNGQSGRLKVTGKGYLSGTDNDILLKLPVPSSPVDTLNSLKVRIEAYRAAGSKIINLGPLKPNTSYTADDLTIKTDDLIKNCVGFKATGAGDRLKDIWLQTRRGNRFRLKWSSKSGTTEKTMKYREFLPLEGCSLCVKLYNLIEPCYIDMEAPTLDLTLRAWKPDDKPTEQSSEWKAALKAEHPELFSIPVPPVEAVMFEDRELYKTYLQGLEDRQIMPAIVQVVDYMIRHQPKGGDSLIQSRAQGELERRAEYLKDHREIIANQLIGIYKHTPKKMSGIAVFFANLNLQDLSRPTALSEIRNGNLRFANHCLFGDRKLAEADIAVLQDSILNSTDWIEQTALLQILKQTGSTTLPFAMQILNDRSLSVHVRNSALKIALENEKADQGLAEQFALAAPKEHVILRNTAASALIKQDPFPTRAISACLTDLDISRNTASALKNRVSAIMRTTKDDTAKRTQWIEALRPLVPILEDLAEQIKEYDAREAIAALEKINELEQQPDNE